MLDPTTPPDGLTGPDAGGDGAPVPAPPGYELLAELGRGGMGVVFQARHRALGRMVALKMILSGEYAEQAERERFQAEAEAVACIQHPGIVQVFEVGSHEGRPFMALEYCPGGSLDRKLGGTPQPSHGPGRRAGRPPAAGHPPGEAAARQRGPRRGGGVLRPRRQAVRRGGGLLAR
ncbi:MAG: protein kinase [Gemmataceae bacterium]|nr:protein kinase [Gemmataceae bacterium]